MEICLSTSTSSPTTPLTPSYSFSPLRLQQHSLSRVSATGTGTATGTGGGRVRWLGVRLRVSAGDDIIGFTQDGRDSDISDRDGAATLRDVPTFDNLNHNDFTLHNDQPSTHNDDSIQPFQEFLHNLGIQLDSEDSFILLLYGGGSFVALWLLTAIVGAIDTIPVVPKLMEVVGLGYSLWFTSRYLLFKKNRKELSAKIVELKREVLGSDDN
ncbi:hypothetical protein vseg_019233 [Gypsophila vaccaria]